VGHFDLNTQRPLGRSKTGTHKRLIASRNRQSSALINGRQLDKVAPHRAIMPAMRSSWLALSCSASQVATAESLTQQRRHFFLDVDDDVSLTQIFTQASILTAKLLIFFF